MIIDTHAHLMFPQLYKDFDVVMEKATAAGIGKIINVGCDLQSCRQSVEMLDKDERIYASLGLHPYDAVYLTDELLDSWRELVAKNKRIVAIGECGLDYFKAKIPKEVQKRAFERQIELACELELPLIVHNRDADEDCLAILDEFLGKNADLKVVFHCYGSDLSFARKLWDRGIFTSFTGIITYPSAQKLKDVVREVPMDLFMVETDCPYLAPQAYRGQRNEPAYVVEVVREIAKLKGKSFKEVEKVSTENAERFFNL